MNGRVSRQLRKIARELELKPETGYAPAGKLRRRWTYLDSKGVPQQGPPIPRPIVLTECFRRAYKEAKKLYKGLPPSMCLPTEEKTAEAEVPFRARVAASIRQYHNV